MHPAVWRGLIQRPSGITTILLLSLLLVLVLVLSGFFCARPTFADPASAPDAHDCCPHARTASDTATDPSLPPCHGGACLQVGDHHLSHHGLAVSQRLNPSTPPLLIATGLAPDWRSGIHPSPSRVTHPVHPPPLQRSRVLRL